MLLATGVVGCHVQGACVNTEDFISSPCSPTRRLPSRPILSALPRLLSQRWTDFNDNREDERQPLISPFANIVPSMVSVPFMASLGLLALHGFRALHGLRVLHGLLAHHGLLASSPADERRRADERGG
jgi:hypothetical protein